MNISRDNVNPRITTVAKFCIVFLLALAVFLQSELSVDLLITPQEQEINGKISAYYCTTNEQPKMMTDQLNHGIQIKCHFILR